MNAKYDWIVSNSKQQQMYV